MRGRAIRPLSRHRAATICQSSYPPNSENASPFGTIRVYLSCTESVLPPKTASTTAMIASHQSGWNARHRSFLLCDWQVKFRAISFGLSTRLTKRQKNARIRADSRKLFIGPPSGWDLAVEAPGPNWLCARCRAIPPETRARPHPAAGRAAGRSTLRSIGESSATDVAESAPEESQQVAVDLIRVRGREAVRRTWVVYFFGALDEPRRLPRGVLDRNDLVVLPVHHQSRDIELLEVLGENRSRRRP